MALKPTFNLPLRKLPSGLTATKEDLESALNAVIDAIWGERADKNIPIASVQPVATTPTQWTATLPVETPNPGATGQLILLFAPATATEPVFLNGAEIRTPSGAPISADTQLQSGRGYLCRWSALGSGDRGWRVILRGDEVIENLYRTQILTEVNNRIAANKDVPMFTASGGSREGNEYTVAFPSAFVLRPQSVFIWWVPSGNTDPATNSSPIKLNGRNVRNQRGSYEMGVGELRGSHPYILRLNNDMTEWQIITGQEEQRIANLLPSKADRLAPMEFIQGSATGPSLWEMNYVSGTPVTGYTANNMFSLFCPAVSGDTQLLNVSGFGAMPLVWNDDSSSPNLVMAGDLGRGDVITVRVSAGGVIGGVTYPFLLRILHHTSGLRKRRGTTLPITENSNYLATTAFTHNLLTSYQNDVIVGQSFPNVVDWTDPKVWMNRGGGMEISSVSIDGLQKISIKTLESDNATTIRVPVDSIPGIGSGMWSASLFVDYIPAGATTQTRFLARQLDEALVEIDGSRVTHALSPTSGSFENRLLSSPAMPILAGAKFVDLWFNVGNNRDSAILSNILIAAGPSAIYRPPVSGGGAVVSNKYVTAGAGGQYDTLDAAIISMGGSGTVFLKHSRDYGDTQRINIGNITGPLTIIGEPRNGEYPLIRLGQKLAGGELVAGRSQVYRFPVTGMTETPHWVWIDDLPDASTLIEPSFRRPQHNGRTHRLKSTKCFKNTSSTLAAALAEMDSSEDPQCFYDSGWLYVTGPSGRNLLTDDLYVDTSAAWISSATRGSRPEISITGVEVRYSPVDLKPFTRSTTFSLSVTGARGAGAIEFYGDHLSYMCEGAGTWNDSTGDGLNGHTHSNALVWDFYGHDNHDDGESTHENGRMRMYNSLLEYNGGTGAAPAYGCDAIYQDCESIRNNLRVGHKPAGFAVVGEPTEADVGHETLALFIRCKSIGDQRGFADQSPSVDPPDGPKVVGRAIDCEVIDPVVVGYDIHTITDCRHSGTGTAKTSKTRVVNRAGAIIT